MNRVLRKVSDFRLITLAVASALSIAAANAEAHTGDSEVNAQKSGTSSVQSSRGADYAADSVTTGGSTTTIDRSVSADGTVNRAVTETPATK